MSLSGAMNVGVTGLSSNAEAITVVGNNIANVNTVGFKEGRTIFSDMLSANINAGQVGRGGQIQAVQNIFSQGSFENTSSGNDLAIQGDAMFVVQDANGSQYFTRAGAFDYNKSNILTNPDGLQVMGYGINATNGLSNGVLGAIDKTAFATLLPNPTSKASMVLNLDSTQTLPGSNPTTAIAFTGKLNNAIAINTPMAKITGITNLRDEYGNLLAADLTLTSGATAHSWTWKLDVASAVPATSTLTGTLTFDATTGAIVSQTPVLPQTINLSNGSKALTVTPDFGSMTEVVPASIVAPTSTSNGITSSKIRLDGTIDTVTFPVAANALQQDVVDANGAFHTMYIEFTGAGNTLSWTMDTVASPGVRTTNLVTGTVTFDGATGLFKSFTQDKSSVTFGALAAQPLIVDFSGLTQTTTA
ncbi:MAG: flagellar hook-basal body complex protein, partial [Deltaproteobacteria bacterium]